MKYILAALLFFLCGNIFAQHYIGLTQNSAEKKLKKEFPGLKVNITTGRDSLLINNAGAFTHIYIFDEKGKCNGEVSITRCDSCYNGLLNGILNISAFAWKKINESQYISRFEDGLMIELFQEEDAKRLSVLKTDWTRELYDLLLKNE